MIYLYKKTNNPKPKTLYVVVFLVAILFSVIRFTVFGDLLGQFLLPVFSFGDNIYQSSDNLLEKFWSKERLLQEVETLREKEKDLNLKLTDISALQSENRELRNTIKLQPEDDFIPAFVIARPPQTSFDTIIINKGRRENVNVGDIVLASESTMIGRVVEAKESYSIILLNSSPSAYFAANISRNDLPLEVFGHGSGNLYGKVPIIMSVEVGDVATINYGKVFSIGIIDKVENDETSGFKNIFMFLPVNISDIGIVFVLPSGIVQTPAI